MNHQPGVRIPSDAEKAAADEREFKRQKGRDLAVAIAGNEEDLAIAAELLEKAVVPLSEVRSLCNCAPNVSGRDALALICERAGVPELCQYIFEGIDRYPFLDIPEDAIEYENVESATLAMQRIVRDTLAYVPQKDRGPEWQYLYDEEAGEEEPMR